METFLKGYMLNKFIVFLFLLFVPEDSLMSFVKTDELNISSEVGKKYNLSICAIFKNEAEYLKKWIEYHRTIGVDHFYLYDIRSGDSFQEVLSPYIKEKIVSLIHWPEIIAHDDRNPPHQWVLSTQIPAYENALNFIAKNETKWLLFVDINEFLVCPKGKLITNLLEEYDNFSGITLASDDFDVVLQDAFPQKKIIVQAPELARSQVEDELVTKMIFKPDHCVGFYWPPYRCRFKNNETNTSICKGLRINRYNYRNLPNKKNKFKLDRDNQLFTDEQSAILLDLEIAAMLGSK